ncbi:MAG TPA: YihY/virulence factor BrkB family protein, partial [Gemmatimonadales bacterium]|nr:YihY/virulence factor BrkB family protein [Gemmatimonadales bacterium]
SVTYLPTVSLHVPRGSNLRGTTMAKTRPGVTGLINETAKDFLSDDCMDSAAALSYYTIFSLPAILVLMLTLISAVLNPSDVRGGIEGQLQALMGPSAGEQIRTIIQQAEQKPHNGLIPTILGIAGLLFGATGAFGQLQKALNRAWNVEPDPNQGGLKNFLSKRVFSLGMILVVAFFLLVSLVISAALTGMGDRLGGFLPSGLSAPLLEALNMVISLAVITLLFAALFKVMPDAKIAWRSVWVGAAVTAFLFVIGKFLIGFYLGQSNPGQAYGAAGSLAVLLLWVYYSALILLFGAEFTETWAERRGRGIEPEPGAVRVRREKQRVGEVGPTTG